MSRLALRTSTRTQIQCPVAEPLCLHVRHYTTTESSQNNNVKVETYPSHTHGGHDGLIAKVAISNPTKMNIVSSPILHDLQTTFTSLAQTPGLRAVILTGDQTAPGKSPAFIGGANIHEMSRLNTPDEARKFITAISNVNRAIRDLPVPVLARVHGYALGAGLEIMASTDLRVATKDSVFGMPEVRVGIPSVVEAALLPGLIGMGRTRRLLYLAENISARVAETWGLVDRVVEDEAELDQVVKHWAETIAEMGPKAITIQKRLMQKWENCGVDEGIQAGVDAFAEAFEDGAAEPKEYMGKFVNRKR